MSQLDEELSQERPQLSKQASLRIFIFAFDQRSHDLYWRLLQLEALVRKLRHKFTQFDFILAQWFLLFGLEVLQEYDFFKYWQSILDAVDFEEVGDQVISGLAIELDIPLVHMQRGL